MADAADEQDTTTERTFAPSEWIPHPVSDHAEYLDRPDPVYVGDLTPEQRAEFEATRKGEPVEKRAKPKGRRRARKK